MSMYHEGYKEAREAVNKMTEAELLEYLDALYGRDNLPENPTVEQIRYEALAQCRRDFTNTDSKEYETVQFFQELHKAMKKDSR